jgi:tetrahydromethanopterin S-methyltransferase subunit G
LKLPAGQVIVSEADLQSLHDRLYQLESAVEDVRADLSDHAGARAYREAFEHLYDSAKDLVGLVVEAVRE